MKKLIESLTSEYGEKKLLKFRKVLEKNYCPPENFIKLNNTPKIWGKKNKTKIKNSQRRKNPVFAFLFR